MAEKLTGPQVNLTGIGGGENVVAEYAPINEAAKQAISGTNPETGKAYTDAELASIPGNYNPYAGAVGYKIEPSGELSILLANGSTLTTGATYKTTSQGSIIPDDKYMKNLNNQRIASGQTPIAFDEYGVQVTIQPDGTAIDSKGVPMKVVYDGSGNLKGSVADFVASGNSRAFSSTTSNDLNKVERQSAYNLLYDEFDKYGLGTLVSDIKNILVEGSLDPAEFSVKVRGTDAYKERFIANEARLAKGLKALSPAQYIALEDQYQEVMRQYGLPETYYSKTGTGVQEGFRKLIENDVSNIELEDRISTAQKRVINANPEVTAALKQFYPDINNADILAYTLDPKNAIENIKRKVTNAEIGGAALQAGLQTGLSRAEELQKYGVDQAAAEKGFGTIAGGLQRGSQLASIYGEDPYTQTTAETEVFGLAGAQEAAKQRKKLTGLEKAAFTGQTGLSSGALVRDRAGAY